MPDITYRNTPYGDVTIYEAWPQWLRDTWLTALKAAGVEQPKPPFVPTYDAAKVYWPNNAGGLDSADIDRFQLPTKETCDVLLSRFGAARVLEFPFVGMGAVSSPAKVRVLQWNNGGMVAAGLMAEVFTNSPEDRFPNVAEKACRDMIRAANAA